MEGVVHSLGNKCFFFTINLYFYWAEWNILKSQLLAVPAVLISDLNIVV